MIYIIDHQDSFTWNVVHQFSQFDKVYCSNYFEINNSLLNKSNTIVLSPGPGSPKDYPNTSKIYNKWSELEPDNPEPKVCRALLHVRNARFDIGWKMYEEGLKDNIREPLPGFYQEEHKLWDGKKFNGTLLVYGEQGLGDQILYGTLLPDLLKVHKKVF